MTNLNTVTETNLHVALSIATTELGGDLRTDYTVTTKQAQYAMDLLAERVLGTSRPVEYTILDKYSPQYAKRLSSATYKASKVGACLAEVSLQYVVDPIDLLAALRATGTKYYRASLSHAVKYR